MNISIYKNKTRLLPAAFILLSQILLAEPEGYIQTGNQCPSEADHQQHTEDVTFLGVYSTKVSPTLTHQLGFPKGFYLNIQQVEPGSPADEAGLQQHDILQKIDDQIIINPEQLRELIRSKESGVNVGITYFRKGREHTASAKLTTRKVPVRPEAPEFPQKDFPRRFLPKDLPKDFLPENFRKFHNQPRIFQFDFDTNDQHPQVHTQTFTQSDHQTHIQINNDNGSLALDLKGDKGHLTIRDQKGKSLYDGEYKKGQEIEGLPPKWQQHLREIYKQIEKGVPNNPIPEAKKKNRKKKKGED